MKSVKQVRDRLSKFPAKTPLVFYLVTADGAVKMPKPERGTRGDALAKLAGLADGALVSDFTVAPVGKGEATTDPSE